MSKSTACWLHNNFNCLSLCGLSVVAMFLPVASLAGDLLSDNELAIISAGAPGPIPDPTGDQPGVADDHTIVAKTRVESWGNIQYQDELTQEFSVAEIHDYIIVEAGSKANLFRSDRVHISHSSQFNLNALNLSNTSRSNLVSGINLNIGSQKAERVQNNWFEQNEFKQANYKTNTNLKLINHEYVYEVDVANYSNKEFFESHSDILNQNTFSASTVNVEVEPFTPDILFDVEGIEASRPDPIYLISPVSRSFSASESDGTSWSLYGRYSGLSITPVFSVNGLETRGEDLFFDVELGLPGVNMGQVRAGGCISSCGDDGAQFELLSIDLGHIERTNIIDGITFKQMNPLNNLELNVNYGLAYAGRGRFSASDSSIGIYGELTARIGASFDFELDLSDSWWVDNLFRNNGRWNVHREVEYEVAIPFTILDFQVDGFNVEFEGALCLKLFGNTDSCGTLGYEYQETLFSDNSDSYFYKNEYSVSRSVDEVSTNSVIHGGILTGAQAELVIMTDSELKITSDSDVNVSDKAQQNLRAVNVVNSAAAISANSLNMDVSRHGINHSSRAQGALVSQRNYFNQRL